jgi:hypothetical protein
LSANSFSFFGELLLASCVSTNFRRAKKFASFSPEFLVLTTKAGVADASVGHDDLRSVALSFLKKKHLFAVNSAGNRGELQS